MTKDGRLAGKVAIVTGGNSGMGAATVEMFVAEGARVMVASRGEDAGRELVARLGEKADFVRTDATVEADVKAMVDATVNKWGRVDCLFNNAASGTPYRTVDAFTMEEFRQLLYRARRIQFSGRQVCGPDHEETTLRQHHQQRQYRRHHGRRLHSDLSRLQSGSGPRDHCMGHGDRRTRYPRQLYLQRRDRNPHILGWLRHRRTRRKRTQGATTHRVL